MSGLPLSRLSLPERPFTYYTNRHHHRKFFSVQSAAELLYRSVSRIGKPLSEIVIMDYGGGVGSLFLLAKMIGCKTVIYNDILEDMTEAAEIICRYLQVPVDLFIAGDHRETLHLLKEKNMACDIILSRNVVEHIYNLKEFYSDMARYQPEALLYFSTTANYYNPAMLWYHKWVHKQFEKKFLPKRKAIIRQRLPGITDKDLTRLARATRGLAMEDLNRAIADFGTSRSLPDASVHYTNTCDPENGVWAEHILTKNDYQDIIRPLGYRLEIIPAFWDTHYRSGLKSGIGKTMNYLTRMLGKEKGLITTAFIYIIAEPK